MLREVAGVKQDAGKLVKRWFTSVSEDLFVWQTAAGEVVGYQFTYDKPGDEKAVIWNDSDGFLHTGVDDGARPGRHPGSPLLVPDGAPSARILALFLDNQGQVPEDIARFVADNLRANLAVD